MSAASHRFCLDFRCVEPGVWLGDAEAGAGLAADDGGQPRRALRVQTMFDDRMKSEDVDVDRRARREGAGGTSDLLHHDRGLGDAKPRTPIFGGHRYAQPSALGDGGGELMRKLMRLILP